MTDVRLDPAQETQPAKGEPVEIPVPTRDKVFDALRKAVKAPHARNTRRDEPG